MAYLDVLDDNGASDRVLAVTASTVELAEVGNLETVDGDGSLTVVLDDLVGGRLGTATLDEGVTVTLEGKSVLADVDPPDVLDSAGTLAVDTLDLVYMLSAKVATEQAWSSLPLPIMAFLRVAPFSRMKTASASPPSAWPVQDLPRP